MFLFIVVFLQWRHRSDCRCQKSIIVSLWGSRNLCEGSF